MITARPEQYGCYVEIDHEPTPKEVGLSASRLLSLLMQDLGHMSINDAQVIVKSRADYDTHDPLASVKVRENMAGNWTVGVKVYAWPDENCPNSRWKLYPGVDAPKIE